MRLTVLFSAALVVAGCGQKDEPKPGEVNPHEYSSLRHYPLKDLVRSTVKVGNNAIPVWVMDDGPKRDEGYMYLKPEEAPDGHGMIFVFPEVQPNDLLHSFWMKNCLLELDIAFISPAGKVINVQRGHLNNETQLPADAPYKSVLELKAGEAVKFGVKPGVKVEVPNDLKGKP